jgi:hypothetical protein
VSCCNCLLACFVVLSGGGCSGTPGSGAPKVGDDAGIVISLPDAMVACQKGTDGPTGIDDGGIDPQCEVNAPAVSFANDVMPILAGCTGDICHAPWRYDTLLGQHSAVCCDHRWLVSPKLPSTSHVIEAVTGVGACVPRMPLDQGSLSQREIVTLITWVCQGALNN